MSASVVSVISRFLEEYLSTTPQRLKLLDAYLLYILLTGALQFGYCLLVGTFPFNSFLSGFISCVGSFILAGNDSISNRNNVLLWCADFIPTVLFFFFLNIRSLPREVVRGACIASFCEWGNWSSKIIMFQTPNSSLGAGIKSIKKLPSCYLSTWWSISHHIGPEKTPFRLLLSFNTLFKLVGF